MANRNDTKPQPWFVKQISPENGVLSISLAEVQKDLLLDMPPDGEIIQASLPNLIIIGFDNPYLEAAMELQLRQDEMKQDFEEGILGLIYSAVIFQN